MAYAPEDHFPHDYRSARAAFLAACEAADLRMSSHVHPTATGPDGRNLFLDTTTIGARDAATALLLISATHGVEGYFGSGVQTGLLRERFAERVPRNAKVVIVHALNPYGFAWDRRVNEDNTDVNRNFVDHSDPPANAGYEAIAEWIAPNDISHAGLQTADAKLRAYAEAHGAVAMHEAISRGQYRFPGGLFYGGARQSWSAAMLRDVLSQELSGVEKLVAIDFHTGLGEHGAGEVITDDLPGSAAYLRQKRIWGDRVKSSDGGESVSSPLVGTIDQAFGQWLPRTELTFATLEVGTKPLPDVLQALRMDNWLHSVAGGNHPNAATIRRDMRAAFYPDTVEWKRMVWAHAMEAVDQAMAAIREDRLGG